MARNSRTDTLPWPDCLGIFDEESCRYFLRELGQRVVQFYPFSVGIEEVYSHIVDEYGLDGAPDAMSVLQELLEDDSTAAGAGDDGDIWRSWRHSWRHRNDNAMNPYIPRVRGRVLDPPTSLRIRLLKNANFVTCQLNQAKSHASKLNILSSEPSKSQTIARASLNLLASPSQTPSFQEPSSANKEYHKLLSDGIVCRHSPKVSSDSSHQDTKEVTDEKYLLPAQRYDPSTSTSVSRSSRASMTDPPRKYAFPFNLTSPRRSTGTASPCPDQYGSFGVDMIPEEDSDDLVSANTVSPVRSPITSALCGDGDLGTKQTPSSVQTGADRTNRYSLPSEFGSTDREATPTRRRATHRQARMIDGALFQAKSRKGKCIESDSVAAGSPVKKQNENDNKRLSGQSTKQHSRESWLHNVLTRFRGEHNRNPGQPKLRKRHSSLKSCGIVGSPRSDESSVLQPDTSPIAEMKQTTPTSRFGFDGTVEEHHNKPLPLSPGDLHRPSVQSDIQRTFFGRNLDPVLLSPDASISSVSQQLPSFHKASDLNSLVSATMSGPHELSPKEKAWRYRLSTSTTKSGPPSPSSFSTFANKNPYHDPSEPSTPTVPAPAPLAYHKQKISSTEWPFRAPQDAQYPQADDLARRDTQGSRSQHTSFSPLTEKALSSLNLDDGRGRKLAPSAILSPSQGKVRALPPKTPSPRSRSPVKRLMGMVKSMSANQISENTPSSNNDTPNSTNKRRWKELSNKLRHGFLTADLEQLEQEEMMEQYSTNNDVQILTPPPSRRGSTFPVSIKSSGQSKLWSELEYMLIETCNTFLKEELANDRLSRDSIIRAKRQWQSRNRPPIIEFYYDQATQYEIIVGNLRTIKLYSDYAEDAIILNSVLHQWKILIRELSVKTLCMPDSIVRRWLHDGRRVLELLGASQITLAHLDRLSGLCFAVFGSAEKQRAKQRGRSDTTTSHRRSASDGSQSTLYIHEQALMNNGTPGNLQVPPLPTPRSMGNGSRKVTPQEQRLAQQARKSVERDRYVFTTGNSGAKMFTPAEEKGRFALD